MLRVNPVRSRKDWDCSISCRLRQSGEGGRCVCWSARKARYNDQADSHRIMACTVCSSMQGVYVERGNIFWVSDAVCPCVRRSILDPVFPYKTSMCMTRSAFCSMCSWKRVICYTEYEIILDFPIGFPINNIMSLSLSLSD